MNFIVLDTETTNGFDDPMVYDLGYAIVDGETFKVLETRSFVNADIFLNKELMADAFFADKIPQYWKDIKSGKRELKTFYNILKQFRQDYKFYNCVATCCHNARFDYVACQTSQRFITKSKYRWFFPFGNEMWCSLKMARQTFGKDEAYKQFCIENGFTLANGKTPRFTAEILYRYITNDVTFEESHTGLEDVLIEKEIVKACLQMNPNIEKRLWAN